MLPATVARENLLDYLRTTYGLTDELFAEAIVEFLSGSDGIFRGSYLGVRLPFRKALGARLPLEVAPGLLPYQHQLRAFDRLHGQRGHQPQHTLVTTGTGSGKTECFLFPVLDHCLRERRQGKKGIKAILLYPMNALASDQARRIARMLSDDPRLQGQVSAGLYVGGKGSHEVPDRDHLVDVRKVLRQAPPDILLTNYKMLDFLLLRPEDQVLWQHNVPETLRFLVLDELHTYDGAQGSDVACLIRRLKARLGTRPGDLTCVGTSATIGEGDGGSKDRLIEFAGEIFDEHFTSDSVITEDRLSIEEALGARHDLDTHPTQGDLAALEPRDVAPEEWVRCQTRLWLGAVAAATIDGPVPRVALGEQLKRHDFLHLLLRALGGKSRHVDEVAERIAQREEWFAQLDADARRLVLDSFVGLIAHARRLSDPLPDGAPQREVPFLSVQVQLWLREVRRLLQAVEPTPRFMWESELGGRAVRPVDGPRYLPIVRCTECGVTGLAAHQKGGDRRLLDDSNERVIGRGWLTRDPGTRTITLGHGGKLVGDDGPKDYLCPLCLAVSKDTSCSCTGAGETATLPVRIGRELTDDTFPAFRPVCHECGAEDSLMFLASRASSLLSVAISHLFQTPYNTDRKLLAFVDAVQDASHRAGFFGARTYRFNLRALLQELVEARGGALPLADAGEALIQHALARFGTPLRALRLLVPEDLRAHQDYERFLEARGQMDHESMRAWLRTRLGLEATFEYGYAVRQGRSLEKSGCSTLRFDSETLTRAVQQIDLLVREDGALRATGAAPRIEATRHFVVGLLQRLRLRGGIHHALLEGYVKSSGNRFMLSRRKNPLGPIFGRDAVLPRFLQEKSPGGKKRSAFDSFGGNTTKLNWYRDWASRTLGCANDDPGITEVYKLTLEQLMRHGILRRVEAQDGRHIFGLDPACLSIVDEVDELVCDECNGRVRLPRVDAAAWQGQPCTKYRCAGHWGAPAAPAETFYTRTFREGRVAEVFPAEHTGLLDRETRERIEEGFKNEGHPNLLVCTPTLEMGIDIGDLSAVLLCSVPPTTSNYLQRIGRAGRSTGNALCITMANARPHDLYFHADPPAMMSGAVDPPGCFLDAPEMLKRQVVASAMDAWARQARDVAQIPGQMTAVFAEGAKFPARFLEFYEQHKGTLLDDFLGRFQRHTLSEAAREELALFAKSDQVRERVHRAFEEVRRERERLRNLQKAARKRHEELSANPELAKEDVELEKADAQANHKVLGRLIIELGKRYPLNVLTDAGVLPNYAFPEPGVTLDSVIRTDTPQRTTPPAKGAAGDRASRLVGRYEAHQYLRPASAALRELAPFNTFYAEGRRVTVDELDLGTPAQPLIELWRMCARCNHSAREIDNTDPAGVCPSCGDISWPDAGQVRKLVYFRRSRSLEGRLEAATSDDGEERQIFRYQTRDLIDVAPSNRCGARYIESLPFGFELLTGLRLREVNFGPEAAGTFQVAGHAVNDKGFQVCVDCGRVKPVDDDAKVNHALTCRSLRNKQERIESVYLYREVSSEAIRILLPVADLDLESHQASFRAALQLGMRRRFGGRAPHLQVKSMREPAGEGHRNYLVVFDAVPGGTGFLADLWRHDALMDVFEDTLRALEACRCVAQGKDGCYRCLFAYQNQRELECTSSQRAQRMLTDILSKRSDLEDIDTLSDVELDSKLESELEERFLRALLERARHKGEVRKFLAQGEERWEFTAGKFRWEVQPQPQLGKQHGVQMQCRPDFLLTPRSTTADPRPIAVFCDGFAYHAQPNAAQSRLGDDLQKRRSILESHKYLVWSIVWEDVNEFSAGGDSIFQGLLAQAPSPMAFQALQRWKIQPPLAVASRDAMGLLWNWLTAPRQQDWDRTVAALGVCFTVKPEVLPQATAEALSTALIDEPGPVEDTPPRVAVGPSSTILAQVEGGFGVRLLGRTRASSLMSPNPVPTSWTLRLYDDHEHRRDSRFRASWRKFLQALVLLQFDEQLQFTSTEELELLEGMGVSVLKFPAPIAAATTSQAAAPSPPLDPLAGLDLLDEERAIAEAVVRAGGEVPEVGYELVDGSGRCVAEAGLAWSKLRIAVLFGADAAERARFEVEGWRVLSGDDGAEAVVDSMFTE
jgi:DEAD/DEAH box helicase domain-containing protein